MAKALDRPARRMTVDQFLSWAMAQPEGARHELVAGEVVAMAPERAGHARRKAALWLALRTVSKPRACRARRCPTA